ncbi:MAG: hypothetical protein IPI60_15595 [Saprospiraceae bacterium]|nr:hypothetical protein [Saprospiraceae bacterium]
MGSYVDGIQQAMVAKWMFLSKLHQLYSEKNESKFSFIGFQIPKTVWSNQLNIIPAFMRIMATIMKFFGTFISIEKCGEIMAPLFTESQEASLGRSGKFITWKKNEFVEIAEDTAVMSQEQQDKLWQYSLELCADEKTNQIAEKLYRFKEKAYKIKQSVYRLSQITHLSFGKVTINIHPSSCFRCTPSICACKL